MVPGYTAKYWSNEVLLRRFWSLEDCAKYWEEYDARNVGERWTRVAGARRYIPKGVVPEKRRPFESDEEDVGMGDDGPRPSGEEEPRSKPAGDDPMVDDSAKRGQLVEERKLAAVERAATEEGKDAQKAEKAAPKVIEAAPKVIEAAPKAVEVAQKATASAEGEEGEKTGTGDGDKAAMVEGEEAPGEGGVAEENPRKRPRKDFEGEF